MLAGKVANVETSGTSAPSMERRVQEGDTPDSAGGQAGQDPVGRPDPD